MRYEGEYSCKINNGAIELPFDLQGQECYIIYQKSKVNEQYVHIIPKDNFANYFCAGEVQFTKTECIHTHFVFEEPFEYYVRENNEVLVIGIDNFIEIVKKQIFIINNR